MKTVFTKNIKLIFLMVFSIGLISCEKDDVDEGPTQNFVSLKILGNDAPGKPEINSGETINVEGRFTNLSNNSLVAKFQYIESTGTLYYNNEIVNSNEEVNINVDSDNKIDLTFNSNELIEDTDAGIAIAIVKNENSNYSGDMLVWRLLAN